MDTWIEKEDRNKKGEGRKWNFGVVKGRKRKNREMQERWENRYYELDNGRGG